VNESAAQHRRTGGRRLGVHRDVGARLELTHGRLDHLGLEVNVLQGARPRKRRVQIDEDVCTGGPHADLVAVGHSRDSLHAPLDGDCQACRRGVHQPIDTPPTQLQADRDHDDGHAQGGKGVRALEDRQVRSELAQADANQPEDDNA
jgi:hypothetical protein